MCRWSKSMLAVVVICGAGAFPRTGIAQRSGTVPIKSVVLLQNAPQQATHNDSGTRQQLRARAKKILADETARKGAGDCKSAQTTLDFNECFGKQVGVTDGNLKALEDVIAELDDRDPHAPDHPVEDGRAESVLSPKQHVTEFRKVEQSWRQYRNAACTAAFHQFEGGTGGPSFELECELRLDRSHMRELDMIYGSDLHL